LEELEAEYKVPMEWSDGPSKNHLRRITDKCCFFLFIVYLLLMIGTAIYAIQHSHADDIKSVYDSSGNMCGRDGAKDYPYLYMQNFQKNYKSVCVKECPTFDYNAIKSGKKASTTAESGRRLQEDQTPVQDQKPAQTQTPAQDQKPVQAQAPTQEQSPAEELSPMGFEEFTKNYAGLSHTHNIKMQPVEAFGFDEGWANEFFTEEHWLDYTKGYKIDCLTNEQFSSCKVDMTNLFAYDSYPILDIVCVPLAPKAALLFNKVSSQFGDGVIGDLMESVKLFGIATAISLAASLIFLVLICCCTSIVTWLLLFAMAITFLAFGSFIIYSYAAPGPMNGAFNAARVKYLYFLISQKPLMITISVVSIILGLFMFFAICKFRKYVNSSVAILSYAAKTTLKNIMLIFLSLFVVIIQICVFFLQVYILLRIYTMGQRDEQDEGGSPFIKYSVDDVKLAFLIIHAFGTYWLIIALNNFNDFVTAAITCNIYYGQNDTIKNINIFCHCLGHHVGSVAWSIVLLPALFFKLIFGWVDFLLTSDNPNGCQRFLNKLFCPCCWCYEKFIDRFSESYFPVVYMGSENFFTASTRFYYLKEKYNDESYMISLIGEVFSTVGKMLIAFLTMYVSYLYYNSSIELQQNIDHVGTIFAVMFIYGFFIGSLFISLYSTTYDTVMVCYLIERNIQDHYGLTNLKCPDEIEEVLNDLREKRKADYKKLEDK
jgi:hypothetical protein